MPLTSPSLLPSRCSCSFCGCSAQLHGELVHKLVGWQLQVLRGWALANAATVVVVGAMAGAEIASVVAGIRLRDAAKVGADTDANQPLRLLAALGISGWLAHGWRNAIVLLRRLDHLRSTLADEHRLAAPLAHEVLALTDGPQINLDDACGEDVLGRPEGEDELAGDGSDQGGCHDTARRCHEIDPRTAVSMANGKPIVTEVQRALWAS
mmetsp:Transcript_32210/g.51836  ORF Transcript_32210/g.51836 Transcript_32210/m.51836 type:complete len:209 (+) Transcript_32210:96-722(+)